MDKNHGESIYQCLHLSAQYGVTGNDFCQGRTISKAGECQVLGKEGCKPECRCSGDSNIAHYNDKDALCWIWMRKEIIYCYNIPAAISCLCGVFLRILQKAKSFGDKQGVATAKSEHCSRIGASLQDNGGGYGEQGEHSLGAGRLHGCFLRDGWGDGAMMFEATMHHICSQGEICDRGYESLVMCLSQSPVYSL